MAFTKKEVRIVGTVLVAVSDPRFNLRTAAEVAKQADTTVREVIKVAEDNGDLLVVKYRGRDGAALIGLA